MKLKREERKREEVRKRRKEEERERRIRRLERKRETAILGMDSTPPPEHGNITK